MIATVTLNPSLDYIARSETPIQRGVVNRIQPEKMLAGGKGLNVSLALNACHVPNVHYGFLGGGVGGMIAQAAKAQGVDCDWIAVQGENRINLKLREVDGDTATVTELNGTGVSPTEKDTAALLEKLKQYGKGDTIVLGGSLPKGVQSDYMAQILAALKPRGACLVVDTSGAALRAALKEKPDWIKPNAPELQELLGIDAEINALSIFEYLPPLQTLGLQNLLLSLGGDGALFYMQGGNYSFCRAPQVQAVNTVGAGDTLLGAFLAALTQGKPPKDALDFAVHMATEKVAQQI